MECINATSLRRKSGQMGHPAVNGPTELSSRPGPDFLPHIAGHSRVCCFRYGKQHEVRQRHQPQREIRGSAAQRPASPADVNRPVRLPWRATTRDGSFLNPINPL
jgi:hypothetical protein